MFLTLLVALAFALMGALALVRPDRILRPFGIKSLPIDARNEVRAVYGGFGVAIAALLVLTVTDGDVRVGGRLAVALALIGMAAGRLVSGLLDRQFGRYPRLFTVIEGALATMLLISI